jgi:hypothetical protein
LVRGQFADALKNLVHLLLEVDLVHVSFSSLVVRSSSRGTRRERHCNDRANAESESMADAAFTTASVFFGLADMGVASGGQRVRFDATMGQS